MAQHRRTLEQMRETLAMRARHATDTDAADASGVSRETFKSRLRVARSLLGAADAEPAREYIAPDIISGDEDLESIISRLEDEDERQEKARTSLEWMEFRVNGREPFGLVFVGDPHADTCAIRTLRQHLDIIEETPRLWAVGLGDWINQWSMKLRGQYAGQTVTERNAYRIAEWLLQKPIWWAIILGNHGGSRWHGEGSPLKWIKTTSATPVAEWQAKFKVICGGSEWKIWAAHNFPGNSIYNANHGPDRRAIFTGAIADLFVAGDRHTFKLSHDQHEHTGRIFWTARAKGYKRLDLYAEELGYSGKQSIGHSIGAVFDPRDGSLVCFSDVEKTAQYLTFLRGGK